MSVDNKELETFFDNVKKSLVERDTKIENIKESKETELLINFDFIKDVIFSLIELAKKILYKPLNYVSKIINKEIKIIGIISFILIFMFVIFVVGWFFFAVLVASFFYENGNSLTASILLSMLVQFLVLIVISITARILYKKSFLKTIVDLISKMKLY